MKKTVFYVVLLAILFIKSATAHEAVVAVTGVQDGDTFSALVHDENTKIRLLDVDCYETKKNARAKFQQKYYGLPIDEIVKNGKQSKKKLKNLLKGHKYIRVEREKRDSFGRILGKVYLGDVEVNLYMLDKGGCNKYVQNKFVFWIKKRPL